MAEVLEAAIPSVATQVFAPARNLNLQIHGLRGFSAFTVFIYHIYGMSTLWHFWPAIMSPVSRIFQAGAYGVEIFFVISGYLITASLIRHQSASKFLIDRCIRIYPVFFTIHILVFAIGPIIGYKWMAGISVLSWIRSFFSNLFFLPGLFDLPLAQLNAWSLSFEAGFYLISALAFVAAGVAGRWSTVIGLGIVLTPLFWIYPIAAFFLVGVAVFFFVECWGMKMPAWLRMFSIPGIIAVLALVEMFISRRLLVLTALIPALVFFWSIVEGKCAFSSFLRLPWLQHLGTISYSFYLWSPVVTYPVKILIGRTLLGKVNDVILLVAFFTVSVIAALAISSASYIYLEDRAGRALRQWAHRSSGKTRNESIAAFK